MGLKQYTFFTGTGSLDALIQKDDPLAELESYIDFEMFRPALDAAANKVEHKGPGGRPRWDLVMMFKVLVLQRIYNLSDEKTEYHIRDSLSFHRFLRLEIGDKVPDSRTIWLFRENLTKSDTIKTLFEFFNQRLLEKGVVTREGTLVDASFVTVPKQHNAREDNALIKDGQMPESWKDQPRVIAQKDTDARWTVKGLTNYYGYKNHVKVDETSKLVIDYMVTPASTNDGKIFTFLVGPEDRRVHADCAYQTPMNRMHLKQLGIENTIHVKGTSHVILTEEQKNQNRLRSKIRARVEHVFGLISNSMGGLHLEYINLDRITSSVGLINLIHNFLRLGQLRPATA
jgi:IS5 family transposase